MLERVRHWAETNKLVPIEQLGFHPGCLLPTRVLSIYQEVKNNMAANIPTLAVYVDYQKAYDKVWHKGLVFMVFGENKLVLQSDPTRYGHRLPVAKVRPCSGILRPAIH